MAYYTSDDNGEMVWADDQCVLVVGSFADGFKMIGPFASNDEAADYAFHREQQESFDWEIVTLSSPNSVIYLGDEY